MSLTVYLSLRERGKEGEAALARFVAETDGYFQPKKSFA